MTRSLLALAGATVTVCHTGTRDLRAEVERNNREAIREGRKAYDTPAPTNSLSGVGR